jgi:hypothetical protein
MRNELETGEAQRMGKSVVWRFLPSSPHDGTRGFLTLSILTILVATLEPAQIDEYVTNTFCLVCPWNSVDILANVLLFVPLGLALILRGVGGGQRLMISTGLSLAVEVTQIWIPGRDPSLTDVASNTLGAAVGIVVAHSCLGSVLRTILLAIARMLTRPEPWLASRLALGISVVTTLMFAFTGILLTPSLHRTRYFVGTRTLENTSTPVRIGGDTIYGEHMHGVIDEVRIYNRAQAIDEIRRDMNTPVWGTPTGAGLVAAYGFDEGTGIAVHDASGRGNSGTISDATWTDQGKFGRAIVFDGQKSLVSIPPSPELDLTEGMTLSAWVYQMPGVTKWSQIIKKEIDAYFLTASSDAGPLKPAGGGTFGSILDAVKAPTAISVNIWVHLALTYDGSTFCLYMNGNQVVCRTRWYPSRVFSISVGDLHLSPDTVFDASKLHMLHMRLLEGIPLRVHAQAARHPVAHPLPFLRVIDDDHNDILFLGADYENLVFRIQTRATSAGFNSPDIMFRRAMRNLSPDEPFTITLWRDHGRQCADVNGTVTCEPGFTIGTGWTLLFTSQYLPPHLQTALNWFWVAAIVLPIGFWAHCNMKTAVAGVFLVMGIGGLPYITALAPTPPDEIGALIVGLLTGVTLRLLRCWTAS